MNRAIYSQNYKEQANDYRWIEGEGEGRWLNELKDSASARSVLFFFFFCGKNGSGVIVLLSLTLYSRVCLNFQISIIMSLEPTRLIHIHKHNLIYLSPSERCLLWFGPCWFLVLYISHGSFMLGPFVMCTDLTISIVSLFTLKKKWTEPFKVDHAATECGPPSPNPASAQCFATPYQRD